MDLEKTFDYVPRKKMWKSLLDKEFKEKLVKIILSRSNINHAINKKVSFYHQSEIFEIIEASTIFDLIRDSRDFTLKSQKLRLLMILSL